MKLLNTYTAWTKKASFPCIAAIILFIVFFVLFLLASRLVINNGDDTSILLEAHDFMHGNLFLQNWHVPSDNFLTIEIPVYAIGERAGISMHLLTKIIPAFFYSGIISIGGYFVLQINKEKKIYALLLFLAIAAFTSLDTINLVLHGPMHMGTIFFSLLGYLCYYLVYKAKRYYYLFFPIIILLTTLLIFGDPLSEVIFLLPILIIEGLQLIVSNFKNLKPYLICLSLIIGVIFANYLKMKWQQYVIIDSYSPLLFADISSIGNNVKGAFISLLVLFHADFLGKPVLTLRTLPLIVNGSMIVLYTIGLSHYFKKNKLKDNTSEDLLVLVFILGFLFTVAAYIFTNTASVVNDGFVPRYLIPAFIFASIFAYKVISVIFKKYLNLIVIVLFAINTSIFIYYLHSYSIPRQPEYDVITLLKQNHLNYGLGEYWSASAITGESNYQIVVRQVLPLNDGYLHPYFWLENNDWYLKSEMSKVRFIIYSTDHNELDYDKSTVKTFGVPDHIYEVGKFVVLAWNTPLFTHTSKEFTF